MSTSSRRSVLRALLITLPVLALSAALSAAPATVRIGASVSLSGPLEPESRLVRRGLELWAEDLNDRGALLGQRVELVLRDDASSPEGAMAAYQAMRREGVELFVSPYSSELTLAVRDALGQDDFAMIAIASAPGIWHSANPPRIFGLYAPADANMQPALELAAARGLNRVAVANLASRFPRAVASGARDAANRLGLTLVGELEYEADELLEPVVERLRQLDPEVLIVGSYMDDALAFAKAAKSVALAPKLIVFSGAAAIRRFGDELGYPTVDGVLSTVQWMRSVRFPGAFDFGFRYRRKHGIYPSYDAAGGYAALQVLEAAIRLADSTQPAAVREELKSLKFRSILGHFRVDEAGRQIAKQTYLVQWQDGHISLVHPPGIARWDLRFPFSGW